MRRPPLVHPRLLPQLRATQTEMLEASDTADVVRPTKVTDSQGGRITVPQTVASVPVLVAPTLPFIAGEPQIASRLVGRTAWTFILPYGTDVRDTDQLRYLTYLYEIIQIRSPHSQEAGIELVAARVR